MADVLEVSSLTKTYRISRKASVTALDDVSFTVKDGEVFGLLGPNGAGKTTLFRILIDLLSADSGYVKIFGKDLASDPDRLRSRIGWMPEQYRPYPNLTARQTLRFYGGFYDLTKADLEGRIDELLGITGLDDVSERKVGSFSFGMTKRLLLCQALVHRPDLLILDEPSNGLDPLVARALRGTLRKLADEGLTIVFSSHALIDVETLSDRVGILNRGRLIVEGAIEDIPSHISAAEERHMHIHLGTPEQRYVDIAQGVAGVSAAALSNRGLDLSIDLRPETRAAVVRALVEAGADIHGMHLPEADLESIFSDIIDRDQLPEKGEAP